MSISVVVYKSKEAMREIVNPDDFLFDAESGQYYSRDPSLLAGLGVSYNRAFEAFLGNSAALGGMRAEMDAMSWGKKFPMIRRCFEQPLDIPLEQVGVLGAETEAMLQLPISGRWLKHGVQSLNTAVAEALKQQNPIMFY